jgi:hypothetical protein
LHRSPRRGESWFPSTPLRGPGEPFRSAAAVARSLLFANRQPMTTGQTPEPADVVREFIAAMHAWENEAHTLNSAARGTDDPTRSWPEINRRLDEIYRRYCTTRDRPYGRNGSYSVPPEYDPHAEHVVQVVPVSSRRVHVITQQGTGFRNRCQYALVRVGSEWRIDNRRVLYDDGTSIANTL